MHIRCVYARGPDIGVDGMSGSDQARSIELRIDIYKQLARQYGVISRA